MSKTFGKDEEVAVSISEQVNETGASSDDEAPVLTLKKSKKNRSDKQVAAFEKMRAAKAAKDAAKRKEKTKAKQRCVSSDESGDERPVKKVKSKVSFAQKKRAKQKQTIDNDSSSSSSSSEDDVVAIVKRRKKKRMPKKKPPVIYDDSLSDSSSEGEMNTQTISIPQQPQLVFM